MIKNVQSLSLLDILPPNLLEDKKVAAAAQALDKEIQSVTKATIEVLHISRIDVLPEPVVDLLAWQWHVDFYDHNLSLEKRRALVENSIRWHMKKGTKAAVEEMVQTVFESGQVAEWFEYGGEPYHFRVDLLTAPRITQENLELIVRVINTVKNVRSWLDGLGFRRNNNSTVYYGTINALHKKYSIGPAQVRDTNTGSTTYMGGISQMHKKYSIAQSNIYDTALYSPYKTGGAVYLYKKISIEEEMSNG